MSTCTHFSLFWINNPDFQLVGFAHPVKQQAETGRGDGVVKRNKWQINTPAATVRGRCDRSRNIFIFSLVVFGALKD